MNREELEARIWRLQFAHSAGNITQRELVDELLAAADQYATAYGGITAERRAILRAADPIAKPRKATA